VGGAVLNQAAVLERRDSLHRLWSLQTMKKWTKSTRDDEIEPSSSGGIKHRMGICREGTQWDHGDGQKKNNTLIHCASQRALQFQSLCLTLITTQGLPLALTYSQCLYSPSKRQADSYFAGGNDGDPGQEEAPNISSIKSTSPRNHKALHTTCTLHREQGPHPGTVQKDKPRTP